MLKTLGNIFIDEDGLPPISSPNKYIKYKRNQNIFKTSILIDVNKANTLNLSYFKTATINKYENSRNNNIRSGYVNLLNSFERVDIKDFIENQTNDLSYDLIKTDILGRNLSLNDFTNKKNVENFANRKSYNYNSALTLNPVDFSIVANQDLFFELAYNIDSSLTTILGRTPADYTKYDLIIYAMDINDQIIDVKKIYDFNVRNVNWTDDANTLLYEIDDVNFDDLFEVNFSQTVFNNLIRQFDLKITDYFKSVRNLLPNKISPIESITIQENDNSIETDNTNILINNIFPVDQTNNKSIITFNTDLQLETRRLPYILNYKLFMKIAGRNSYIIKNFTNRISDNSVIFNTNLQNTLNEYLRNTRVFYLSNFNVVKIDLNILNEAFKNENFNLSLSSIFINNDNSKNYATRCFSFFPESSRSQSDLNLLGNDLKQIALSSVNSSLINIDTKFTFYLQNLSNNPLTLNLLFESNYEKYSINFSIERDVLDLPAEYSQFLNINQIDVTRSKNYSNLDIEYGLKIKNFKTSNSNLNRILSLNYQNIYLQELQLSSNNFNENFENNIFVILKKSIYQTGNHIKDKYYIFNKNASDSFNNSITLNEDLDLNLNFKDEETVNNLFFSRSKYDNVDLEKNVKYTFEARIFVIPLGFGLSELYNEHQTKRKIKEVLMLNNPSDPIPSDEEVTEIYVILQKINDNNLSNLTQYMLYKLYQKYSLKTTQASNEKQLNSILIESNIENNLISFLNSNLIIDNSRTNQKTIQITLNFNIQNMLSDNTNFNLLINKISEFFEAKFYFRNKGEYINLEEIIPDFNRVTLQNEFKSFKVQTSMNSKRLNILLTLTVSNELLNLFNNAYTLSSFNFSPNQFEFLKNNTYFKLSIPKNISISNNLILDILNIENQYIPFDFYNLL